MANINPQSNSNPFRIYLHAHHFWLEVSREEYERHTRSCNAQRRKMQRNGFCCCPRKKWWVCDGDCDTCEYRTYGNVVSLDEQFTNADGDVFTRYDIVGDGSPNVEDVVAERDVSRQMLNRVRELMPEAIEIGKLRDMDLSLEAAAAQLGIPRTTLTSRLDKLRKQLQKEFPDNGILDS